MQERQKRIMAINDISCFGKCSLTVALPILSAAGFETCPVPTALLSTHTGGFKEYTFKNLDDQIMPVTGHWKKLGLKFDAIYSGYLGSFKQIEYVENILEEFAGNDTVVLIDPVMGDNGVLYTGFDRDFVRGMFELCKRAEIIVPNITEASYMLNLPYKNIYSEKDIEKIFEKFLECGINRAVITGIPMENDVVASGICDDGEISFVKNKKIEGMYHGTGDVFASAMLCGIMRGKSLRISAELASRYVYDAVFITKKRYGKSRYGVDFESLLMDFVKNLE